MKINRLLSYAFSMLLMVNISWSISQSEMSAAPVSPSEARRIAADFMGGNTGLRLVESGRKYMKGSAETQSTPFYIFNVPESKGFVIVSGDDRLPEILGYSDEGSFPENLSGQNGAESLSNNIPPQLEWLLDLYACAAENPDPSARETFAKAPKKAPIKMETASWGQEYPYNMHCPKNCLTGCGATALAIVMKYHSDPRSGRDIHSYDWNGQRLSYDFNHKFNWNKMLPAYMPDSYSQEEAEAVADLMYACGVLLQMVYGELGSSSSNSLAKNASRFMYYDPSCWYVSKDKNGISDQEWREMIDTELDRNCPVLYRGAKDDNSDGHSFVLDGRDSEGRYHINWGWNGYLNGYFLLSGLTPDDNNDYRFCHAMMTDFYPAEKDFEFSPLITEHYLGGTGLIMNRESVRAGDEFFASVSRLSSVVFEKTSEGEVAIALVDDNSNIREILATDTYSLRGGYGYQTFIFPGIESKYNAAPGDRLSLYYRTSKNSSWKPVPGSYKAPSSIPATEYVPEYATISWKLPDGVEIWSTYYQHQDRALKYSRYYFLFTDDTNIADIYVTVNGSRLEPNENGWFMIEYVDQDEYEIKVYDAAIVDEIGDAANSGITEVYTIDGIKVLSLPGSADLDNELGKLPKGIYIVKEGADVRKMAVGN